MESVFFSTASVVHAVTDSEGKGMKWLEIYVLYNQKQKKKPFQNGMSSCITNRIGLHWLGLKQNRSALNIKF